MNAQDNLRNFFIIHEEYLPAVPLEHVRSVRVAHGLQASDLFLQRTVVLSSTFLKLNPLSIFFTNEKLSVVITLILMPM